MLRRTRLPRRTPLSRGSVPLRRVPLRVMSAKRRAENRERAKVLRGLVEDDPWCRIRLDGICTGLAQDGHEPLLRSRGGDPADPNQIVLACRACHDWVHNNAAESAAWLRHSWDRDAQ